MSGGATPPTAPSPGSTGRPRPASRPDPRDAPVEPGRDGRKTGREGAAVLRRLSPDHSDWPAIRRLILDAFAFMEGRIDPPSSALRLTGADLARHAAEGAVFVVEEGGEPVACLIATPRPGALYLGKLAVRADRRGRGLARALIDAAEGEARRLGLPALELQSRVELVENHAAFAALGFVETERAAHPGFDRPTSIRFRRPIGEETPT